MAALAGPTAYTISTLDTGHSGSIVTAGPAGASMMGGRGGGPGGGDGGMRGGGMQPPGQGQQNGQGQQAGGGQGQQGGGMGQPPAGGMPGQGQNQGQGTGNGKQQGTGTGTLPGGARTGERGGMGGGGGMGGLLNGAQVSAKAKALVEKNADDYTWAAAAIGSQNAASYQLSTGKPVMAIGGFNGSDPSPTLAQFKSYVEDGKIHYFIGGGMGGMGGGSGSASKIQSWVEKNYTKVTVGSSTFYDLTKPKS